MKICRGCKFNSKNDPEASKLRPDEHCTNCGCTLAAKTRCLSCKCPLENPLWAEVLTPQQEEDFNIMMTNGK